MTSSLRACCLPVLHMQYDGHAGEGFFLSIEQFVGMVFFAALLSYRGLRMLSCGWSVGPVFAFHAALELETFISCPRAVFGFDSRRLPPVEICNASRNFRSISRENRVSLRDHALANFCFMEVPHFRFPAPTHHFTSPSNATH